MYEMTRYRSQQEWIHQPSMIRYLIIVLSTHEIIHVSLEAWQVGWSWPIRASSSCNTICHNICTLPWMGSWDLWEGLEKGGSFPNYQQGFSTFNIFATASWWVWSCARKIDTAGRIFGVAWFSRLRFRFVGLGLTSSHSFYCKGQI